MSETTILESLATPADAAESAAAGAILARVRLYARLRAAWMERLWSEGQTSPDQGLAITPSEVRRILAGAEHRSQRFDEFLNEPHSRPFLIAALEADDALANVPFWIYLTSLFDLTTSERDLLCLLIAIELDPGLGRVFAYLADDTRATTPTLLLSTTLFQSCTDSPPSAPMLPNVLRWCLARPVNDEPAWRFTTAWEADEALVRSVREERWVDPSLDPWCTTIDPGVVSLPVLYPELLAEVRAEFAQESPKTGDASQVSAEFALAGAEGSGRQTLAAQLSASLGRSMIAVDTTGLLARPRGPSASPFDDLVRAVRLARARSALLYWRNREGFAPIDWARLRTIAGVSLTGVRSVPSTATWGAVLPPLTAAKRFELWGHLTSAPIPSLVRTQRLTPAEICVTARSSDEASMHAALARAVPRSSDLLNILPCPYTWDDLVVTPELFRTLRDFEAQIRLRWEVYEGWGFNRLTHLGQGISALFGGPSGTGKTMSAQVLARSLDLTLYRVDLAGVVNKYIGETEKRLREVFDACERSGGLLFFDEADALFGSRMQVNDSHDRFANIEIDYLLQRIEQFDGVAILATNRKNDLDTAFLRRLRFVCDFLPPGKTERFALWHKALPARSPSGEVIVGEIDFDGLAEHLELNGAQIKAIALGAAFLARSEGTTINMQHIELAAARELSKQGQRLRRPFAKPAVL